MSLSGNWSARLGATACVGLIRRIVRLWTAQISVELFTEAEAACADGAGRAMHEWKTRPLIAAAVERAIEAADRHGGAPGGSLGGADAIVVGNTRCAAEINSEICLCRNLRPFEPRAAVVKLRVSFSIAATVYCARLRLSGQ